MGMIQLTGWRYRLMDSAGRGDLGRVAKDFPPVVIPVKGGKR